MAAVNRLRSFIVREKRMKSVPVFRLVFSLNSLSKRVSKK